jgi:hypothetical protein
VRNIILASSTLMLLAMPAWADQSVAGDWRCDLGEDVVIEMTIAPDGRWNSETRHRDEAVRQMRGTYTQKHAGRDAGTLVFRPTYVSKQSGPAHVETDRYRLTDNGARLHLTANRDTMACDRH